MRAHEYEQRLQRWDFSTRYVEEHELDHWYLQGYDQTGAVITGPFGTQLYEVRHGGTNDRDE